MYFSGLLTGKFKRGDVPDPGSSRIGYMLSKNAFGQLGAWTTYSESDQYWEIIDLLKDISTKRRKMITIPFYLLSFSLDHSILVPKTHT